MKRKGNFIWPRMCEMVYYIVLTVFLQTIQTGMVLTVLHIQRKTHEKVIEHVISISLLIFNINHLCVWHCNYYQFLLYNNLCQVPFIAQLLNLIWWHDWVWKHLLNSEHFIRNWFLYIDGVPNSHVLRKIPLGIEVLS